MSDAATLPVAASSRLPAALPTGNVLERIRSFTRQPAVAKSLPAVGLIAALAIAFAAWMTFATGPQQSLFSGLGDADKAAVADQLTSAGIKYSIDRSTGAVTVSEGDYYRAKMLLAQAGLPKSAPDGDSVLASLPMGASRALEGERVRGAREMDLARTIEAIDAVESAKVHLAVEQQSVFVRDAAPASASVMLRLRQGRALSDGQVQAIVNLVATSVPGLSPDHVSVVDQAGHLLSRQGGDGGGDRQLELQQRTEQGYRDAITKLLTPLVGADGFTAEVHTDLDFAEVQATRESYPKDTAVIKAEAGGWNKDQAGAAGQAGGIPGAIANQPPTTAQVTATPPAQVQPNGAVGAQPGTTAAADGGKTSETYNRTFELGREVSVTRNPTGTIKRLSVAVALKQGAKPRSVAELAQIEQLVKGAVGFDTTRGDQFALSSRAFADVAADSSAAKWYEASWVGIAARNGSALLIALLAFFGIAKPLMKKRGAASASGSASGSYAGGSGSSSGAGSSAGGLRGGGTGSSADAGVPPSPEIQREIAAAIASEAVADPSRPVTLDMIEAAPGYTDRATLIRNFVRQDPARAALVVRDLIRADMPGAAQNG
ncbi:flagellar basal-body MS-ring/collar protein FliF [Sphingomonas sp. BIUV-7]|uniref:Flagellar M-ring protein n=1 Tax=Sphingomonas natans TaxID=3063330 RepID=A0ABT8YDR8_9SPHN|nr:flagellar basal-body MS-ring/collar protein FliF [Sphingomonas sp. BIUV-7]MDO6416521.1 flagellar basal-body MS-ring/collar protein FliF [Sphingomonas sp. BIUV-7]